MSHNRKNINRQFPGRVVQHPQVSNRRFVYLMALAAAVILIVGLIVSGDANASTAKRSCTPGPTVPGWAFNGIDKFGNPVLGGDPEVDIYKTAICGQRDVMFEKTKADNPSEVITLQNYFVNSYRNGMRAFCKDHAGRAILITTAGNGPANIGKKVKVEHKRAYKKWLDRYAAYNFCIVG